MTRQDLFLLTAPLASS